MKNIVKDRFDNIGAMITNNRGKIEIDFMKKQKLIIPNEIKNSKAPLLPDIGLDNNPDRNNSL